MIAWFIIDLHLPNQDWEFGYYGQFNRVKHVIERTPDVVIVDSWQHKDITLEDFGFTLRLLDGREVEVNFFDGTLEKREPNKVRLKRIIQDQIDTDSEEKESG